MRAVTLILLLLSPILLAREAAQSPLPTIELSIRGISVRAEVADEDPERQAGLMFRTELGRNAGMLFVMPTVGPASFWMKNTPLPLSIAYISPAGRILEIHDLEPHVEKAVRSNFQNIAFALEMRRGWFSENGVFAGDTIKGLPPHPAR